jgi:hypothetical protein
MIARLPPLPLLVLMEWAAPLLRAAKGPGRQRGEEP